jgi:Glutaminase
MKLLILIGVILCSQNSFAHVRESSVNAIDISPSSSSHHLVLLNDGHVLKVKRENGDLLSEISDQKSLNSKVFHFEYDDDRFISKISFTKHIDSSEKSIPVINAEYVPTTVASMETLRKYFKEAPYNPKESQCFNRAMVWSFGWWRKHSMKSMKLFIFFTREYIRRYNFEWWFHVAPYSHVMEDGKVVERVLDVKYSSGPLSFKKWSDIFMKNDADCRVITKYSDYADYPYTGDCYYQRATMYTYQPADLQMNEAWGYSKDNFNMTEVRGAYKEAFDIDL